MKRIWTAIQYVIITEKLAILYCEVVANKNVNSDLIIEYIHIWDKGPIYTTEICILHLHLLQNSLIKKSKGNECVNFYMTS